MKPDVAVFEPLRSGRRGGDKGAHRDQPGPSAKAHAIQGTATTGTPHIPPPVSDASALDGWLSVSLFLSTVRPARTASVSEE